MNSTNRNMQKRIFDLEQQLCKANDKLAAIKKKCDEKNSQITSLKSENTRLRKKNAEHELLASAQDNLNVGSTGLIFFFSYFCTGFQLLCNVQ